MTPELSPIKSTFSTVDGLIKTPVPVDDGALLELIQQLTDWGVTLVIERAQAYQTYLEEHERLRMPKDKEYTDFDRTSMANAAVASYQAEYERLKGLENLLFNRLGLLNAIYLERIGYVTK